MDGVKVTYIETQFVTSDAASFKDLVQRLTGRSPTAAAAAPAPAPAAPHRPRACSRTAAAEAAKPQGYHYYQQPPSGEVHHCQQDVAASDAPPPCQQDELLLGMDDYDFSDLFYVGAGEERRHGVNGFGDLLY